MSLPDRVQAEEEESWAQIEDPKLRKRVQNRLSQRKHSKALPEPDLDPLPSWLPTHDRTEKGIPSSLQPLIYLRTEIPSTKHPVVQHSLARV